LCNITKCCTEVCPEDIHITDNAIIPLKERVVDEFYDPLMRLWRRLFKARGVFRFPLSVFSSEARGSRLPPANCKLRTGAGLALKLKPISREGIPQAIAKVERYRYLNEPGEAESICRDILAVEPDHQVGLRLLGLSITDQFSGVPGDRHAEAESIF